MSEAIGSRSRVQCHSHHQKMLKKYEKLDNLVQKLIASLGYAEIEDKKVTQNSNSLVDEEKIETVGESSQRTYHEEISNSFEE